MSLIYNGHTIDSLFHDKNRIIRREIKNTVVYTHAPDPRFRFANVSNKPISIGLNRVYGDSYDPPAYVKLERSSDGVNFEKWDLSKKIVLQPKEVVFLRGENGPFSMNTDIHTVSENYHYFTSTGPVECFGSIMDLCDGGKGSTICEYEYQFYRLFEDMVNLLSAPMLPATKLAESCYGSMFKGCTSLIRVPELPATTLAPYCYEDMFRNCTSLIKLPKSLSATLAEGCYRGMFWGCTSLKTTPELPVMQVPESSYENMFRRCTSLTTAPELPATSISKKSYFAMFCDCTSLIRSSYILPSKVVEEMCYAYMFRNCTSLRYVPELPATNLRAAYLGGFMCYAYMFEGCTSLIDAPKLPADALSGSCYLCMFRNCTSLVDSPALSSIDINSKCYQGMFEGCTSLKNPPLLPSRRIYSDCYSEMFKNCTSLTRAPFLPADDLTLMTYKRFYVEMFSGCSNLNRVELGATMWAPQYNWLYGVSPTGTFVKAKSLVIWDGTGTQPKGSISKSDIPSGWTIVE